MSLRHSHDQCHQGDLNETSRHQFVVMRSVYFIQVEYAEGRVPSLTETIIGAAWLLRTTVTFTV